MMPKAIQKPPYEESAVAPKVFPTAISLVRTFISVLEDSKERAFGTYHMPASNCTNPP